MSIDKASLRDMPFGSVPDEAVLDIYGTWYRMIRLPSGDGLENVCVAYELYDQEHPETSVLGTRRGVVLPGEQIVCVFIPNGL